MWDAGASRTVVFVVGQGAREMRRMRALPCIERCRVGPDGPDGPVGPVDTVDTVDTVGHEARREMSLYVRSPAVFSAPCERKPKPTDTPMI